MHSVLGKINYGGSKCSSLYLGLVLPSGGRQSLNGPGHQRRGKQTFDDVDTWFRRLEIFRNVEISAENLNDFLHLVRRRLEVPPAGIPRSGHVDVLLFDVEEVVRRSEDRNPAWVVPKSEIFLLDVRRRFVDRHNLATAV